MEAAAVRFPEVCCEWSGKGDDDNDDDDKEAENDDDADEGEGERDMPLGAEIFERKLLEMAAHLRQTQGSDPPCPPWPA